MGIWLTDELTESDEWLEMSHRARSCLVELWSYCKRAGNDGVIRTERLHRASDSFAPDVLTELVQWGWAHKDGGGCGTDVCPPGIDGYTVMHNYVRWQETSAMKHDRIDKRRESGRKGGHTKNHTNRGIVDPMCPFCTGKEAETKADQRISDTP